jgi:hypothetical protein
VLPPEATGRAVKEYLAVLDDEAFGAATDVVPKFVSPADPAARWTGAHGGQAFSAYSTNYLIDVDNGIIVDVEDHCDPIERSIDRFDLYPAPLLGDIAYGSAEMLGWLVYKHGIEPHVTVFDKSTGQDGTFSRDDFTYDHVGDVYPIPAGVPWQQPSVQNCSPCSMSDNARRSRAIRRNNGRARGQVTVLSPQSEVSSFAQTPPVWLPRIRNTRIMATGDRLA